MIAQIRHDGVIVGLWETVDEFKEWERQWKALPNKGKNFPYVLRNVESLADLRTQMCVIAREFWKETK